MKKFLKLIPIFLAAIVLAVFFVPGLISVNKVSADSENYSHYTAIKYDDKIFENQAMFLQYAGNTLVGVDSDGSVWRSETGTVTTLTKTGVNLSFTKKLPKAIYYDDGGYSDYTKQATNLLTYGNGTLLFVGNNGTDTIVYKSIDQGKTWTTHNIGLSNDATDNHYAYDLMFGNDMFVLVTISSKTIVKELDNGKKIWTSTTGESWEQKNIDSIPTVLNYGNGFFIATYISDMSICFKYTQDFNSWKTDLKSISIQEVSSSERFLKTTATKINNSFFAITPTGRTFVCTGTNQEWRQLNTLNLSRIEKIYPYENGVIAVSPYNYEVYYLEISDEQVSVKLMYTYKDNFSSSQPEFANVVAISDNYVTVGGSDIYGNSSIKPICSDLITYTRNISHRVEFRDYNNSLIAAADVVDGNVAVAPIQPSRTGYKFVGWDKDITAAITEDTVFTAVYEANLYNVTFKDEETGDIISTVKVAYNTQIPSDKIPTPTKDGYQFVGWDKDVKSLITGDITFNAKFSKYAYITFTYPVKTGTFGLLQQFHKTEVQSKKIQFTIGEIIENNGDYKSFIAGLNGWVKDFDLDGKWDYDVKFLSWDKQLPTHINEDITVTASYEKLNLVRLVYYSQLRFKIEDDYFYTFISEMNIERLLETGAKINVNDFKRADVDYEIYNANRDTFYNNLVGFNFKGWDKDISEPVSSDIIIKGIYDLPTFEIRYYDADLYLIETTNNQIDFMGIENLIELLNRDNTYLKQYKHFFRSGIIINVAAINKSIEKLMEKLDVATYIQSLQKYNDKSTRLITPFVVIDSDRPDAYGGIFTSGKIEVDSAVLTPFAGDLQDHDKSYYISPIMFTTSAYPMSATVIFTNKLHSAIKSFNMFFGAIGSFFKAAWKWIWKILIVAGIIALICFVLYLFKEPLRRTIDNANKKRIEQKQENQRTKQQLKQSKQNNNHFKSNNFKSTKRKK